jgi:hypothetical protein
MADPAWRSMQARSAMRLGVTWVPRSVRTELQKACAVPLAPRQVLPPVAHPVAARSRRGWRIAGGQPNLPERARSDKVPDLRWPRDQAMDGPVAWRVCWTSTVVARSKSSQSAVCSEGVNASVSARSRTITSRRMTMSGLSLGEDRPRVGVARCGVPAWSLMGDRGQVQTGRVVRPLVNADPSAGPVRIFSGHG